MQRIRYNNPMTDKKKMYIKRSITKKLLLYTFSIYLLLTFLVTTIHFVCEYYYTKNKLISELEVIESTFRPSLSKAIWDLSDTQVKSILRGMVELPQIIGVELKNSNQKNTKGIYLDKSGNPVYIQNSLKLSNAYSVLKHQFELTQERAGKTLRLGHVSLYTSSDIIFQRIKVGFLFVIFNALIKTTAFWIIFLWIGRIILTRPLQKLTHAINKIDLYNIENQAIDLKKSEQDELKLLELSFNSMIKSLSESRQSLKQININLEHKVKERTGELSETNEKLKKEIEERKLAEKSLKENEAQKRAILDGITTNLAFVNENLEIQWANKTSANSVNMSPEEMIGIKCHKFWADPQKPCDNCPTEKAFKTKKTEHAIIKSPDGRIWDEKGEPVFDDTGKIIGVIEIAQDITEKKQVEEELEKNRMIMSEAEKLANIGGWEWDIVNDKWTMSDNWLRIHGCSHPNFTSAELLPIAHPDDRKRIQKAFDRVVENGEPYTIEHRIVRQDDGNVRYIKAYGDLRLDISGKPIKMFGTAQDITEQKKMEESLKSAITSAEAANRAKSSFLANMSHEIRTPINSMLNFSKMLKDQHMGPLNPMQSESVDNIIESSNRLLFLINDILDLSRVEAGKIEIASAPFNINQLMAQISTTFSGLARKKNLTLNTHVSQEIPKILIGDEYRIGQVLKNLISNAVKFTEQGRINVSIRKHPNNQLIFKVCDTGIGISKDNQLDLFTKFYQVDSSYAKKYAGTGLGLAISKELVELMGGEIGFESEVGKGSTFYFTIMMEVPEKEHIEPEKTVETDYQIKKQSLKILLAEDDDMNLKSMNYFLKREGHVVIHAKSGIEVLNALEKDDFDIILMDVQMPEMDGVEATREIRSSISGKYNSQIPIIALTAYAMKGDKERFLDAGMNDYISKPFDYELLFEKMNQLVV